VTNEDSDCPLPSTAATSTGYTPGTLIAVPAGVPPTSAMERCRVPSASAGRLARGTEAVWTSRRRPLPLSDDASSDRERTRSCTAIRIVAPAGRPTGCTDRRKVPPGSTPAV
jgi:hypothetical protein